MWSTCLAKLAFGDESFEVIENGLAVGGRERFRYAEASPEAKIFWGLGGNGTKRLRAEQLISGDGENLGELSKEVGGSVFGLSLVVGKHPARDPDPLGELRLSEAASPANTCESAAEGFLGG
jgi:hypothetical protein